MVEVCPVLKIECPAAPEAPAAKRARAGSFWAGLVTGADFNASMAKSMAWVTLASIVVSWFYYPERSITELVALLGGFLAYIFGGKAAWLKYGNKEGSL